MLGKVVDEKYRLLRLLGEGGMGAVYEAEPVSGGRRAALKLIVPDLLSQKDGSSVGRFHREARAASAIDTDHIVRVLDAGTDPATSAPYMVMELLEGEDLEQLLEHIGTLKPDTVLRIAAQVCLGLEKAHAARVIHRDIKPANLFLAQGKNGEVTVKILDFGIAKIKPAPGDQTSGLTRAGGILGSPRYMSPEQARGSRAIDFSTDLWSLGVVLYRALSGKLPHSEAGALGDLIISICTVPPRLVQELAPWVPPEVAAVVHGALTLDPSDRFASATAMLAAIRPLLPTGWALDEDMLVPAGDETRQRFVHLPPASRRTTVRVAGAVAVASGATTVRDARVELPADAGPTRAEVSREGATLEPSSTGSRREPGAAPAGGRHRAAVGAGIAVAVAVGALGLYQVLGASPAVPGSTAGSPAPAARQRVKLAVEPADVSVEVDGARVPVENGFAAFEGTPGSTHSVRLFNGSTELRGEVIVTDRGASPAKMTLAGPRPARP